jgi:ribonuclease Z
MEGQRQFAGIRTAMFAAALTLLALMTSCASSSLLENSMRTRQEEQQEAYAYYLDESEIKVVLVGTAGPMSPELAQNSTAVFVNGKFFLFDAGDYAQKRMEQFNLPFPKIDAVFLTHFHNDHIADVGEVMQRSFIMGRTKDLNIYGPTGTEQLVDGFIAAYTADSAHRTDHHGEEYMPSEYHFATPVEFDADETEVVVYDQDGVVVTAFAVSHPPIEPVFGYKIEFAGKKVIISGDTLITDGLREHSESADLVVMDTMNYELVEAMEKVFRSLGNERNATIFYDIREYHPNVRDIAAFATEAQVARLALTHYAPSVQSKAQLRRVYVNPIREGYDGEIIAGGDGTTVVIPLD